MIYDVRSNLQGAKGPLFGLRAITLDADYEDARGFIFMVGTKGTYTFTPVGAEEISLEFDIGGGPNVQGVPAICESVKALEISGEAAVIAVGNL